MNPRHRPGAGSKLRAGRRFGAALLIVGTGLGLTSGVGLWRAVRSDDDAPTVTAEPSEDAPAVATSETPEAFVRAFAAAVRAGDTATLLARLHPAVFERYGEAQCASYLPSVTDTDLDLVVRAVTGPGAYTWETDGSRTDISDAYVVEVSRKERGETLLQEIHLARAVEVGGTGGTLRWFTDCGEVVGRGTS